MKIRSIRMQSFGNTRERYYNNIPDGLTVIVGNNESGKTTTMEFMRSTMFPGRPSYPIPSKTDSGSMEIETDTGERRILQREGRKVTEIEGRPLPEVMTAMDQRTYRSVFAMDLADLTDTEAISSENIKNRFLTIPGGELVSGILKDIETSMTGIMNTDRITTKNLIGKLNEDILLIKTEIGELEYRMQGYDTLASQKEELQFRLSALKAEQSDIEKERIRRNRLEAQRENLGSLSVLNNERRSLEYSEQLSEDAVIRYAQLVQVMNGFIDEVNEYGDIEEVPEDFYNDLSSYDNDLRGFMHGYDKMIDRREELKDRIAEDEDFIEDSKIPREMATEEVMNELEQASRFNLPIIPIILFIAGGLVMAGLGFTAQGIAAGAALCAFGLLLLILKLRTNNHRKWMESRGYPPISRDRLPSFIVKLGKVNEAAKRITAAKNEIISITNSIDETENGLITLMADLDIEYTGMKEGSAFVSSYVEQMRDRKSRNEDIMKKTDRIDTMSEEIDSIVSAYGGKETFEKMCTDNHKLKNVDIQLSQLRGSIETASGMTVQELSEELAREWNEKDMTDIISEVNRSIGDISRQMNSLLSDDALTVAYNGLNSKRSELAEAIKEWGVLSLEESIVNHACSELYGQMQPSVIETANRYLGMMTDNRYSIDPDPRLMDVVIRDKAEHKTSKQWSSGLGDQVYLSLKMAVAKEMGSERMPMILDDILVRFDIQRKARACEAILEFAKDQQVFLFSCDTSIRRLFPDGTNIIELGGNDVKA